MAQNRAAEDVRTVWQSDAGRRPSPQVPEIERKRPAEEPTGSYNELLGSLLTSEIAESTWKNYRTQWLRFADWALREGVAALPADPLHVAAYLAERLEVEGQAPATLRLAAAAISFVHRAAGLSDPRASEKVKRTLSAAARKSGRAQKQAKGLTGEGFMKIVASARLPRLSKGGRKESPETAHRRGSVDIAMIALMRDTLLRVSEASELTWEDIVRLPDGSGRAYVRRSKTDQEGEGAVLFVSAPAMDFLREIRGDAAETERVFGLGPAQMSKRIKRAAREAGLGDGFSGHSTRVGMAQDLARAGTELTALMNAGRWKSTTMPAHYTRNERAGRGAVAQYYGYRPVRRNGARETAPDGGI